MKFNCGGVLLLLTRSTQQAIVPYRTEHPSAPSTRTPCDGSQASCSPRRAVGGRLGNTSHIKIALQHLTKAVRPVFSLGARGCQAEESQTKSGARASPPRDPQTRLPKHQLPANCTNMPAVVTLETYCMLTGVLLARRQHREDV